MKKLLHGEGLQSILCEKLLNEKPRKRFIMLGSLSYVREWQVHASSEKYNVFFFFALVAAID